MKSNRIFFIIILFLLLDFGAHAQVTFRIISLPVTTPQDATIYITGDFNDWSPGELSYKLSMNAENQHEITLPPGSGNIEFKFTRGSWETVEGTENGTYIPNRNFNYGNGQTVEITISGWEDLGGSGGGNSTAAANVHIMSENFEMPQLNRTRRIWIYLPPDYDSTSKNYSVLYMHDGQNLFDVKTSFAGEWKVDESLNTLYDQGYEVPVVVGIDNGGSHRIDELTPWKNNHYGGGDGEKYTAFIVETLKPYVDSHYRTKSNSESTGIMGSSLGGLISHYAMVAYPEIFGKIGLFSPSYWFSDTVNTYTSEHFNPASVRAYMMCGDNEGDSDMVPDMQEMAILLQQSGLDGTKMQVKVVPGGQHNEASWGQQFSAAVKWMFQLTQGIDDSENKVKTGYFYPNPSSEELYYKIGTTNLLPEKVDIISESGMLVKSFENEINFPIKIGGLSKGNYVILTTFNNSKEYQKFMKN
jgi:predicted alpha/beta superfamily hydrolase